ncbi:MAG: GntR family transcriptional regulator [Bacillota bacterium]|nr:GntR family transcriptional regulator [Bacillota bacterium]
MKKIDSSKMDSHSLTMQVFNILQNDILNGELEPGESLVENRISDELGVSRTPVREAISKLELEGLVESVPNKGSIVVGIKDKDIRDIYTIRMYIEGLAANWSAANITEDQLSQLRNIVELQEFYVGRSDYAQIWQLDTRFHKIIYDSCNSTILKNTLTDFHHFIQKARELSIKKSGRAEMSVKEHYKILEALEQHDSKLAEALISEHISNARANLSID